MATTLGKRKRRAQLVDHNDAASEGDTKAEIPMELQNILRQHFEAAFEPLGDIHPLPAATKLVEVDTSNSEIESDWEGFSEGQSEDAEVINHSKTNTLKANVPREEFKAFMSTKPPSSDNRPASTGKRKELDSSDADEASTDAANLKKDIALQRLLKESHLLDSQASLSHSGQNRHKALDLRLQDMGSRSSIFAQQNMPLAQRKGIKAKAAKKEEDRRRMAQENGIILEKAVKGKRKDDNKRQRGIGAPSVGKFQGGILRLSKKDVAEIEGPRRSSKGRK